MADIFLSLTLLAYYSASALFIAYFLAQREAFCRVGAGVLAAGLACHTAALIVATWSLGRLPVATLGESLLVFSWTLVLAFLLLFWRFPIRVLGALATPLAALMVSGALILPGGKAAVSPLLSSTWVMVHVGLSFMGIAALTLAGLGGLFYLAQERQIKKKKFGFFYRRLPSLEQLDALNYWCLTIGFPLLTGGMIIGSLYAQYTLGRFFSFDPKEVLTLIAWMIYAVLLHERLTVGWRGRRAALLALCGFGVLLITFVGAGLWFGGYHSFTSFSGKP
jgi:cytochrome c-type biogenesis protein CcsB|uniref:C-type cytochrome biogenesis protein CcsB n=1 Tax=Desulfobacca acetoxidans TaxID=60893 RepID=A0A7C3UZC9_9BACT